MITVRDSGHGYTATEQLHTGDTCIVYIDGQKVLAICSPEDAKDDCTGCMLCRPDRRCTKIGCGNDHFILVSVDALLEEL